MLKGLLRANLSIWIAPAELLEGRFCLYNTTNISGSSFLSDRIWTPD